MTSSSRDNDILRRVLIKVEAVRVLDLVDELDLSPRSRISAVVGVPLRNLAQRRDVALFAAGAPMPAVRAIVELLAIEPLEKVVEALGENAESPSFDELAAAIDEVKAGGTSVDEIVAVLGFAIGEEFPAAAHCRRLLQEREDFVLPELATSASSGLVAAPREVDPALREARRARREAQKRRKIAPPSGPRRTKLPRPTSDVRAEDVTREPATEVSSERRRARLTPREESRYDREHPSAGSVILVDVPFDAVDRGAEETTEKLRPALVVAASSDGILVRAIYSQPYTGRQVFGAWRRLLAHASYIADEHIEVSWPEDRVTLGELDDEEWNLLQ